MWMLDVGDLPPKCCPHVDMLISGIGPGTAATATAVTDVNITKAASTAAIFAMGATTTGWSCVVMLEI